METATEQQTSLFKEISTFYAEVFLLTPLAAKIYSFLIFDFDRYGYTFEELLEKTGAAKSSVSENLKLLAEKQLIASKSRDAERKRYFFVNHNYIKVRFEEINSRLQREIKILDQLHAIMPSHQNRLNDRQELFKKMLEDTSAIIQKTLNKI